MRITIPEYRKIKLHHEESYTVFCIQINIGVKLYYVEKRYSQFEELHKRMKKYVTTATPEFPPKKMMKFNQKVLDQRRLGLESYLQNGCIINQHVKDMCIKVLSAVCMLEPLPQVLRKFLQLQNYDFAGSMDSLDQLDTESSLQSSFLAFPADAFLQELPKDGLPDIVMSGALQGFYGSSEEIR